MGEKRKIHFNPSSSGDSVQVYYKSLTQSSFAPLLVAYPMWTKVSTKHTIPKMWNAILTGLGTGFIIINRKQNPNKKTQNKYILYTCITAVK